MKYEQFKKRYNSASTQKHFVNEHGEEFIVIVPDSKTTVYITGDELDWEVQCLFDQSFSIWSADELIKLADAIKELAQK